MSSLRLSLMVERGGCSAKLAPKTLDDLLRRVPLPRPPEIIVGAETHDDAGVYRLPDGTLLVQTTDFFPPMVDDPGDFGRVAAANALSDVYAMGGRPLTALSLVMFPSLILPETVLVDMLNGAAQKVAEAGAVILGGHTLDDHPLKFGLAVTGVVSEECLVTNAGAKPGDLLVLSKALGTGVLCGARRADLIDEAAVRPAIDSMTTLNRAAASAMCAAGVRGATDVTGFGLLGHAYRFADGSDVTFRLESQALPVLPGVLDLLRKGAIPGGCMRNLDFIREHTAFLPSLSDERKWLALDPQTSGGLLMAVCPERLDDLLSALKESGCTISSVIGEVLPPGMKRLLLA